MTLRARLGIGFFAALVGPALLATGLLAGALPAPAPSPEQAGEALRLVLSVRCEILAATAHAQAVQAAVAGDSLTVIPAGAPGPWAACGGGPGMGVPAGTHFAGLAAQAEVRAADGALTGYAYAVQPLDDAFLDELSAAAGVRIRTLALGDPAALPDLPIAIGVDTSPVMSGPGTPIVVAVLCVGVVGAALMAWWLAGLATRPLRMLIEAVDRVAAGDLTARAELGGRDETGQLGMRIDELIVQMQQTQRLSVTDELTGLGNLRQLAESVRREIERANRFGRALGVLAMDLDHFKDVNDQFGHRAGDAVLTEFAARVRGVIREVDLAFRQGGEEFVVLLPETDIGGSLTVARRCAEAIRAVPFTVTGRHAGADEAPAPIPVTVSIGVAVFPRHASTGVGVLDAADEALYAAKAAGRDTYVLAGALVPDQRTSPVALCEPAEGGAPNGTTSPRTSAAG